MSQKLVTILVPNYRTLKLTKLCLRLLRKHTDLNTVHVLVIDNDSQDESLDYLKTVKWIELIERKSMPDETPVQSHARALDMALSRVSTPYVLSIHTDTLIKHPQWLDLLLEQIQKNNNIAGVGSWKLESKSVWRQFLKLLERQYQLILYRFMKKKLEPLGTGQNYYYLRSHCALYRMDLLKRYNLRFGDGDCVAGKAMHRKLMEEGFDMVFLPSEFLIQYLEHVNHATTVLNPELSTRASSVTKGNRRIQKSLAKLNAEAILKDNSLDMG